MYQYRVVYQSKDNPDQFLHSDVIAFNRRSLNRQILEKLPFGFRYLRAVITIPGARTDLAPATLLTMSAGSN